MNAKQVFGALCLVSLLAGLAFGLMPVTDHEVSMDSFGDTVKCGSAFLPNDSELTEFGQTSCDAAGRSRNRTFAIVLIVVAIGFGIAAVAVSSNAPAAGGATPVAPGPQPGAGPPSDVPLSVQLADLDQARSAGLITDEEHSEARRRLLGI